LPGETGGFFERSRRTPACPVTNEVSLRGDEGSLVRRNINEGGNLYPAPYWCGASSHPIRSLFEPKKSPAMAVFI